MKRYCSIVLPVVVLSLFVFSEYMGRKNPKTQWICPCCSMIDTDDKRAVVGFMDHTFAGAVEKQLRTEQRPKGDPHPMPYTIYNIKVLKNIKGELSTTESITVAKYGGLMKNKKVIQLSEGDALLEVGKVYIFNMYVTDDGGFIIGGPHCNVMLEDSINTAYASGAWDPSILNNSELVKEYEDAYQNQLDFPPAVK